MIEPNFKILIVCITHVPFSYKNLGGYGHG